MTVICKYVAQTGAKIIFIRYSYPHWYTVKAKTNIGNQRFSALTLLKVHCPQAFNYSKSV